MRSDDQRRKLFKVLARGWLAEGRGRRMGRKATRAAVARQDSRRGLRQHQRRASRV